MFRRLGVYPGTEINAYAAAALGRYDLPAARHRIGELNDQNLIGETVRGRYRLYGLLREHARALAADRRRGNPAAIGRLLDY